MPRKREMTEREMTLWGLIYNGSCIMSASPLASAKAKAVQGPPAPAVSAPVGSAVNRARIAAAWHKLDKLFKFLD